MKDIPGYEGLYAVTEDGRVWSYPKYHLISNGGYYRSAGRFLKFGSRAVYPEVHLGAGGRPIRVHRLVALTYIPNPEGKPQVNHKNGNKWDNRVENLEWTTSSENIKHSYDTLNRPKNRVLGEKHGLAKLTEANVREIRVLKASGLTLPQLSTRFGVCTDAIWKVTARRAWKHVH